MLYKLRARLTRGPGLAVDSANGRSSSTVQNLTHLAYNAVSYIRITGCGCWAARIASGVVAFPESRYIDEGGHGVNAELRTEPSPTGRSRSQIPMSAYGPRTENPRKRLKR